MKGLIGSTNLKEFAAYSFLFCFTMIAISCSNKQNDKHDVYITSFSEETNTSFFTEAFSEVKAIPLNTGGYALGGPEVLRLKKTLDGLYTITDNQTNTVYVFDKDGTLISRISKTGRGPGEYTTVQSCEYSNHRIVLLTDSDHIIEYNEEGELIKELNYQISVDDFLFFDNGKIAFLISRNEGDSDIEDRIQICDDLYQQEYSFYPQEYQFFNYGSHLSKIDSKPDLFLYVQPTVSRLDKCDSESIITSYHFDFNGKEFPKSLLAAEDFEVMLNIYNETPEFYSIANAFENRDYLLLVLNYVSYGEDKKMGQWLISKTDLSSRIEFLDVEDSCLGILGMPLFLTSQNEVIYLCESEFLDSIIESMPDLSVIRNDTERTSVHYYLLICKIRP